MGYVDMKFFCIYFCCKIKKEPIINLTTEKAGFCSYLSANFLQMATQMNENENNQEEQSHLCQEEN